MSSRLDCIFEIHQLWQSVFSGVYSSCCCLCSFEFEIIKIGQSSYKMYRNKILNVQVSTTILNACTKKFWNLLMNHIHVYIHTYIHVCVCVCVCKKDLVLNSPQGFICHTIPTNQPTQSWVNIKSKRRKIHSVYLVNWIGGFYFSESTSWHKIFTFSFLW